MAFTTPATSTAGTVLTASFLNTYVRDNVAWMATDSPSCRAYNNANISIPDSTFTAVTLNSERFDNAALHSTSSNTSRLTVPTGGGGKYVIGLGANWTASASGALRTTRIEQNATTVLGTFTSQPSASHGSDQSWSTIYALSDADYVEMYVFQNSGGALNLTSVANSSPEFWTFWMRT